jgi:hypothetical protein
MALLLIQDLAQSVHSTQQPSTKLEQRQQLQPPQLLTMLDAVHQLKLLASLQTPMPVLLTQVSLFQELPQVHLETMPMPTPLSTMTSCSQQLIN